uniref:Uncharacterized protein n=1 Tax=Periophthalmus magnuspinnatus TaxID=409849 RepID=A0A3B4AKY0_9GOBI
MRRSKIEVDRYVSSVQSSSPSLKEVMKGFLFAKLYFEAKEYELAKSLDWNSVVVQTLKVSIAPA